MSVRSVPLGGAALAAAGGFIGLWFAWHMTQDPAAERSRATSVSRGGEPAPAPTPSAERIEKLRREAEQQEADRQEAERREMFGPDIAGLTAAGKNAQGLYEYDKDLGGGVKMRLVLIPAGTFMMGSPDNEPERDADEGPQHQVNVNAFLMGKYEVAQRQWRAVMGNNPSYFKDAGIFAPVEWVSWNDCKQFCEKTGLRLPSEAEWEYACRAGTTTRYSFGDDESEAGEYAWYGATSGGITTHPVGQKKPNGWGLYDMHGNVWEWCEDEYHDSYNGAPTDGSAWTSNKGGARVLRGGSWLNTARSLRAAFRDGRTPAFRNAYVGVRVSASVSPR
ncbi:MAG: formylglycine-generating enzyme family protein [Planctomycetes bacterium]|nr:formylglycine-generating enzyme family protein [Planctomycetota bacterium]